MQVTQNKANRLFVMLGGFFLANAIIAEFIGVKIFSLELTLGFEPASWSLFGSPVSPAFTAGVLLWPLVFIMTDIINEYFGFRGVRFLSNMAVGLISYAFLMIYIAIYLSPAEFWKTTYVQNGVPDAQLAFSSIFGQGMWIIVASLTAFLVGQIIDVMVFQRIRKWSGEDKIWLRSTGSTVVSQLVDSYLVLFIAFYLGSNWSFNQIIATGTLNYIYKVLMALVLTPVLYVVHHRIDKYLGPELSQQLKSDAIFRKK